MLTKLNKCIYTPKSKIHLHLGWQSLFIQELGCSDNFNVLIRIIQSTDNTDSVYTDVNGVDHPGMLINYNYLSHSLCLSRRTIQRILNQLEADGYINRIKLGRGKVLAQTTQKTCDLRDEIHTNSSAYKANDADYQKFSKHFEVIYTQQKDIANLPKEINPKSNLGQIVRDETPDFIKVGQFVTPQQKTNPKVGQIGTTPLNVIKVNTEKTIIDNQYQVLETETQFENSDCLTVIFYFDDFGLSEIAAESTLFDYFTVAQSQVINTIVHAYGKTLDITAFNEILGRKDLRREAQSFKQLIDWAYSAAIDVKQDVEITDQAAQPTTADSSVMLSKEKDAPNSNTVNLMDAFSVRDTDIKDVIKIRQHSATQQDGGSATATVNTAIDNNDKLKLINQDYHKNSTAIPTANDLKMPVVEKEVLRKDWASLADQAFYNDVLPDCQKIALVAIIDYVKRKGVAIGSDQEIYSWLYHTVSNHQHYYSRAANFKHLANILMKQLMHKRFEKPSGFNGWEKIVNMQRGNGRCLNRRE